MPTLDRTGRSRTRGSAGPRTTSSEDRPVRGLFTKRRRTTRSSDETHEALACALGWFSIGLGTAEVLAPRTVAHLIGLQEDHRYLLRTFGVREILSGIGILSERRPAGWVWSRLAGDAMDLSYLGATLFSPQVKREKAIVALAAVLGITTLDWIAARQLSRMLGWTTENGAMLVKKTVTIDRPAEDLYQFWRDFQNLSQFMDNVESVEIRDQQHSHWTIKGPAGSRIEWEAEITDDQPHQRLAWRTLLDSDVEHTGSVEFSAAPGHRGTVVKVVMEYQAPGGVVGASLAKIFGREPGQQVQNDLRRFKQVMETGEVLRSDGTFTGIGFTEQRSAQPAPAPIMIQ